MPFHANLTCFRSAFLIRLLQFVKEIFGWRPGCGETETRESTERKRERERGGGDEEARETA